MLKRILLGCAAVLMVFLFLPVAPAQAQAVNAECPDCPTSVPPGGGNSITGPCQATGHWVAENKDRSSTQFKKNQVVTVPQKDTVKWFGNEQGHQLGDEGPDRKIKGSVVLDLPVGSVTVDDWGNLSPDDRNISSRYANNGKHSYDLPSFLVGVEMTLHGDHAENGTVVCSGSVRVKIAGSATKNPLFWGGLVVAAIAFLGMVASGMAKPFTKDVLSFEDINPG